MTTDNEIPSSKKGFAALSKERVAEIASKGGKACQAAGKAHRFTPEEAAAAGRKGGRAPHVSRGRPRRTANEEPVADDQVETKSSSAALKASG